MWDSVKCIAQVHVDDVSCSALTHQYNRLNVQALQFCNNSEVERAADGKVSKCICNIKTALGPKTLLPLGTSLPGCQSALNVHTSEFVS